MPFLIRSACHRACFVLILAWGYTHCHPLSALSAADEPSLFLRPGLMEASHNLQLRAIALVRNGQLADAVSACEQGVKIAPFSAVAHYNLGCLYAKSGQLNESLTTLKQSVALGFRDLKLLNDDPDLAAVRKNADFAEIISAASLPFSPPQPTPGSLKLGVALVGPENTVWDESTNLLSTSFAWNGPNKSLPIIREHGIVGKKLWKWFSEKTAAGNYGDLYDNCDHDHSNLNYLDFPQIYRIEYRREVPKDFAGSLQTRILHGGVVLGNSSTAFTASPQWRSNPRLAYVQPNSMASLTRQYLQNHLYVYPEHNDHDAGHNGKSDGRPGGFGDVFPANTPYVLISQGSSYTDQPFLDALACTLAAFHPDVKRQLVEKKAIAPTLQQIFRSCYARVQKPDDYLTGVAHPSAFEGSLIDTLAMVEAAHAMTLETIPPLIRIRVEKEELGRVGRDYFEPHERERLFDTPCAIARIGRSTQYRRKMIVSTRESVDLNQKPLRFEWVVLRGDDSRITIEPLDSSRSRAEITVAWHPRRKVAIESDLESNRVDIGVFAHNGETWSAPAFVTWYFLDNEDREYDADGRLKSVAYHGGTDPGNYTDPMIQTPKTWTDTYHYTPEGRPIGWTRTRGIGEAKTTEEFTADGGLVIEQDDQGRPVAARVVHYFPQSDGKKLPTLQQITGDLIWRYQYASPEDRVGFVSGREISP